MEPPLWSGLAALGLAVPPLEGSTFLPFDGLHQRCVFLKFLHCGQEELVAALRRRSAFASRWSSGASADAATESGGSSAP